MSWVGGWQRSSVWLPHYYTALSAAVGRLVRPRWTLYVFFVVRSWVRSFTHRWHVPLLLPSHGQLLRQAIGINIFMLLSSGWSLLYTRHLRPAMFHKWLADQTIIETVHHCGQTAPHQWTSAINLNWVSCIPSSTVTHLADPYTVIQGLHTYENRTRVQMQW